MQRRLVIIGVIFFLISACAERKCDETKLHIGMSKTEVIEVCGKPDSKNYINGIENSWFYDSSFDYIAFDSEGKVKYWDINR